MTENLHENNHIDKLFKAAIEGGEEAPPPKVWESIDKSLDKNKVVSIYRKYSNLKKVAAVLLLFALAVGLYALHVNHTNREMVNAQKRNPGNPIPARALGSQASHKDGNDNNPLQQNEAASDIKKSTETKELPATDNHITGTGDNKTIDSTQHAPANTGNKITKEKSSLENLVYDGHNNKKITVTNSGIAKEKKSIINNDIAKKVAAKKEKLIDPNSTVDIRSTRQLPLSMTEIGSLVHTPAETQQLNVWKQNKLLNLFATQSLHPLAGITNNAIKIKTHPAKEFPLSATIFLSPEQTWNHLSHDRPGMPGPGRDEFKRDERYRMSMFTGVLLSYNMDQKWSIQSGLAFSSSILNIAPKKIYAQQDNSGNVQYRFNCSPGYSYIPPIRGSAPVIGDSVTTNRSKNSLQYFTVPLAVKYTFTKGRFDFGPSVGFAVNLLKKGTIETTINNSSGNEKAVGNKIDGLKPAYFSGLISFGAEYKLNQKISIGLAPTARLALSAINLEGPVKTYPNSLGIAAGLHIKL